MDVLRQVDSGAVNIRAKVEAGFMVRTAVDKNLVEQNNKCAPPPASIQDPP